MDHMPLPCKNLAEVGQHLRGGSAVGPVILIDEKDPHASLLCREN